MEPSDGRSTEVATREGEEENHTFHEIFKHLYHSQVVLLPTVLSLNKEARIHSDVKCGFTVNRWYSLDMLCIMSSQKSIYTYTYSTVKRILNQNLKEKKDAVSSRKLLNTRLVFMVSFPDISYFVTKSSQLSQLMKLNITQLKKNINQKTRQTCINIALSF